MKLAYILLVIGLLVDTVFLYNLLVGAVGISLYCLCPPRSLKSDQLARIAADVLLEPLMKILRY